MSFSNLFLLGLFVTMAVLYAQDDALDKQEELCQEMTQMWKDTDGEWGWPEEACE